MGIIHTTSTSHYVHAACVAARMAPPTLCTLAQMADLQSSHGGNTVYALTFAELNFRVFADQKISAKVW